LKQKNKEISNELQVLRKNNNELEDLANGLEKQNESLKKEN